MLKQLSVLFLMAALIGACSDDDPGPKPQQDMSEEDMTPQPDMGEDDQGEDDMSNPDMTEPDMEVPDETVVTCENTFPASGTGLCETTPGGEGFTLYQAGAVLAPDAIYENGYVLVNQETGRIACTGCDCADEADAAGATVVACADAVLSPALINTHEHMTFSLSQPQSAGTERFDHRHDWRTGARGHTELGRFPGSSSSREAMMFVELRNIFAGTVSIAGQASNNAQGLARNLEDSSLLEGLDTVRVDYRTFPLGDSNGALRSSGCDYGNIDSESRLSADIYMPHVAEGIDNEARNEFLCLSNSELAVDLLEENTAIVHGIGLTAEDIAEFAANGSKLVWSPRSNIGLYGMTARVQLFKQFGVTIALGTDWSPSGSADMLRELKCADYLNANYYEQTFSDRELWQMATENAAVAMGISDQVGMLKVGQFADLALFEMAGRTPYRAVIDAGTPEVALVTRAGEPLLGDSNIVEALVASMQINACEVVDVCGRQRRLCLERDTGLNLQTVLNGVHPESYGPFFCEDPPDEPTCEPYRPGEFVEGISATDSDGDGIPDAEDNCPYQFNPLRPIEDGVQANVDGDDFGDECDVCPLTLGDMCEMYDPNDRDSDGIPNATDNCPAVANPDQTDADGDGIGDVCDVCPEYDNTNDPTCPATIYEIRQGIYPIGTRVTMAEGIVTAVTENTVFVQVPEGAGFNGVENSGLQLFFGNGQVAERPTPGDVISVAGALSEFGDALQMDSIQSMNVISTGNAVPAPQDVTPAEVINGGAKAETHQGVLIRITDVTVTSENPDAPQDFQEFEVDGLRVDDLLYLVEPRPTIGEEFMVIVGVLHYSFGNTKILPRVASDVLTGPPSITGFSAGSVSIEVGATGSTLPDLEVVLSGPALGDTTVDLTYTAGISGPAQVVVPNGESSVEVLITGVATGVETVSATLDGQTVDATVVVYDDATVREIIEISPATADLPVDSTQEITLTLNVPAPAGGLTINLSVDGGFTAPATVTVPEGNNSVSFDLGAPAAAATGTLTATLGASTVNGTFEAIEGVPGCLIISEYVEGSGSNNKAIELFNCSGQPLQLDQYGICLISNAASTCSQSVTLDSVTLAAGEVHTLCKSKTGSNPDPLSGITANCDQESAGVMNHNGDDRFILYVDSDNDGSFGSGDTIADTFGQPTVRPASTIWSDKTYRRCDLTPFDGQSAFNVLAYYNEYANGTVDDFGIAPNEPACAP